MRIMFTHTHNRPTIQPSEEAIGPRTTMEGPVVEEEDRPQK